MFRILITLIVFTFIPPTFASEETISGKIVIDSAFASKVKKGDVLFIYAKALHGPRMPLAVYKVPATRLPMDFILDDAKAPVPMMSLSKFLNKRMQVFARVSKSGDAMPKSGDLEGISKIVQPGAKNIMIKIDHEIP